MPQKAYFAKQAIAGKNTGTIHSVIAWGYRIKNAAKFLTCSILISTPQAGKLAQAAT
jgi:hypothetical protein